ncbi:MAG: hypothetical protein JNK14_10190 [Chitinophagaceae bacterium]|nr:hypothetical protein [Chitinophagaceae bacterium]
MQKDKLEVILSVIAASLFILLLMVAVIMLFRIYIKRKNKLLLEKEMMAVRFEQTLLQSKVEIQEETFTYISRELHDNIGQVLSLASINLNSMHVPSESERMTLIDDLLTRAMADLRNLSHSLDTDYIRVNGWAGPVRKLLSYLEHSGKYAIDVNIADDLPAIDGDRAIILYRIMQEVINNIIKHAGADRVGFHAEGSDHDLRITISDNGKGFDTKTISGGAGLRNLENRAKMINGSINFASEHGQGTTVTILIKTESIEQGYNVHRPGR